MSPPKKDPEGKSIFASLRSLSPEEPPPLPLAPQAPEAAPAPPAPPAPPRTQPPAASAPPAPAGVTPESAFGPLLERLARLEAGLKASSQGREVERIAALEKQLKETQEKALAATVMLREREEAQRAAQRETESLLQRVSQSRRSEELDRQLREQMAADRKRIEELEANLMAAATGANAVRSLTATVEAQSERQKELQSAWETGLPELESRLRSELSAQIAGCRQAIEGLAALVEARAGEQREIKAGLEGQAAELEARLLAQISAAAAESRGAASDAAQSIEAQSARQKEIRSEMEALKEATGKAAAELEKSLAGYVYSLDGLRAQLRGVSEAMLRPLNEAMTRFKEEVAHKLTEAVETSRKESSAAQALAANIVSAFRSDVKGALSQLEGTLRSELERQVSSLQAAAESQRAETDRALRDFQGQVAEISGAHQKLDLELAQEAADRREAIREAAQEQGERLQGMQNALSEEAAVLGRQLGAEIAALRDDLEGRLKAWQAELEDFRAQMKAQSEIAKLVEYAARHMKEDAATGGELRQFEGEWRAHLERLRADLDKKLAGLSESGAKFETEVRGLILSRLQGLESRLKGIEGGSQANKDQ